MKFTNSVEKKSTYAIALKIPNTRNFRENAIFSDTGLAVFFIMREGREEK